MITFDRKPGLNSYWVRDDRYTKLAGRIFLENLGVVGYGRFQIADLKGLWDFPFIKIFKDGNALCALVGGDLQEGTAEFVTFNEGSDLFDQITDHGIEFQKKHNAPHPNKFVYWEPLEIEFMAEQAKAGSGG